MLSMPAPTSLSAVAHDDPSKDMGCCHLGVGFDQLLLSLGPIMGDSSHAGSQHLLNPSPEPIAD